MKRLLTLLILVSILFPLHILAEQNAPSPIAFIYDASGSMWGQIQGQTKMQIAADVLSSSVESLPENQKIGLVAYGHRRKGDCRDVEFLIDIENESKSKVIQSLKDIKPLGKTPLAYSAMQVIEKLRASKQKATVILLTDGIESCDGNICDVVKSAKKEGIDFRLHIIGFGLKTGETETLKCAAAAGDGNYYDAADAGDLGGVLNEATRSTVDEKKGNFTVHAVRNSLPVDAYVKAFEAGTQKEVDTKRTYADTAYLHLPAGYYDLVVTPLEGSDLKAITVSNVQSFDDEIAHRTVRFDAGKLNVTALNNGEGWDAVVNISSQADGKSAARGRTYGKTDEFELNPGAYRVELKALKMKGAVIDHIVENVQVEANQVHEIKYSFKSGIAMIGAKSATGLVDATVRIVDTRTKKNVANGRTYSGANSNPKKFILTPGNYEVRLVTLGAHKGKEDTFTITVKEGETVSKITDF